MAENLFPFLRAPRTFGTQSMAQICSQGRSYDCYVFPLLLWFVLWRSLQNSLRKMEFHEFFKELTKFFSSTALFPQAFTNFMILFLLAALFPQTFERIVLCFLAFSFCNDLLSGWRTARCSPNSVKNLAS
jgi:hypothetical protein